MTAKAASHVRQAIGVVGLGSIMTRGILFIREGFLARALGASGYGTWVEVVVFLSWLLHLPLGYQNVLSRDVPFLAGRGDQEGVRRIQDAALRVTLVTAVLAAVAVVGANRLLGARWLPISTGVATLLAATILAQQYNGYQSVSLRAHERFVAFSVGAVVTGVISLGLAFVLVPPWGLAGAIGAHLVGLIAASAWWVERMPPGTWRPVVTGGTVAEHLPSAIPLFLGGALTFLTTSLDRLFVVFAYPPAVVGLYGFAFALTQAVHLVVSPTAQVLNPLMMRDFGHAASVQALVPYLRAFVQVLPSVSLVVLGAGTLLAPPVMAWALPDFLPSLPLLHRLAPATAFFIMAGGAQSVLVACRRERMVVVGNVLFATTTAGIFAIVTAARRPVGEFAGWVLFASAGGGIAWTCLAAAELERGHRALWRAASFMAPVALLAVILEIITRQTAGHGGGWGAVLVASATWILAGGLLVMASLRRLAAESLLLPGLRL